VCFSVTSADLLTASVLPAFHRNIRDCDRKRESFMPSFNSGTENQFTKGKFSESLLVKELEIGKVNVQ
jgi:hypothetical protein